MMDSLFVWAGGRWCALDAASGRVRGWRRRARFVYGSRGRLRVARSSAVLRALRQLLAGQPSAVRDGAPLPQRRCKPHRKLKQEPCAVCALHQHCCAVKNDNGCTNNNKDEVAVVTAETGVQTTLPSQPRPAPRRRSSSCGRAERRRVRATVHRSSSDEPLRKLTKPGPLSQKPKTQSSSMHCKELIINENDVDLYRAYLIKHDPEFDLYRFDCDESYKLTVFFRINPLVNIEKCARIERMLRASQSSQEMSLKDFATRLGLRSISDQESETSKRYKMRSRIEKPQCVVTSDDETDKENQDVKTRPPSNMKVLEERREKEKENQLRMETKDSEVQRPRRKLMPVVQTSLKSTVPNKMPTSKSDKERVTNSSKSGKEKGDKGGVVSDSSGDFVKRAEKKTLKPMKKIPVLYRMQAGSKTSNRSTIPYSSLEDQAIVSWVSLGARASLVNGNRVWRELQADYAKLTGCTRSWHSLRNRYLRYILPALPALALPHHHAARLRAAAAKGHLKKKSFPSRRNSIFAAPAVRSASARLRPARAPPSHTQDQASGEIDETSDSENFNPKRALRSSAGPAPPTADKEGRQRDKSTDTRNGSRSRPKLREPESKPKEHSAKLDRPRDKSAKVRDSSEDSVDESRENGRDSSESVDRSRVKRPRGRPRKRSLDSPKRAKVRDSSEDSTDTTDSSRESTPPSRAKASSKSPMKRKLSDSSDHSSERRERHASLRDRSKQKSIVVRDSSEERLDGSRDRRATLRDRSRPAESVDSSQDSTHLRRDKRGRFKSLGKSVRSADGRRDRTPTYEQLTRQFAARLRSTPNDASDKSRSGASSPPHKRVRKLYNPNTVMR